MGSWGHGIRQDDLVCDVIAAFDDAIKEGSKVSDATASVLQRFDTSLIDSDDAPLIWLAIADAQWTYGQLDPQILAKVSYDISNDIGLSRWREMPERQFAKRRVVLSRFLEKIQTANPKPKRTPKRIVRNPKFEAGDCLAVRLSNGQYGAALVLASDSTNLEYGQNLICVLDFMSTQKPLLHNFSNRQWLMLTHHKWDGKLDLAWYLPAGFRAEKSRFELVAKIEVLPSDPKESKLFSSWSNLGEQVIHQRDWDQANG